MHVQLIQTKPTYVDASDHEERWPASQRHQVREQHVADDGSRPAKHHRE